MIENLKNNLTKEEFESLCKSASDATYLRLENAINGVYTQETGDVVIPTQFFGYIRNGIVHKFKINIEYIEDKHNG